MRGFEPPAPSSRTKCATKLRYIPLSVWSLIRLGLVQPCRRSVVVAQSHDQLLDYYFSRTVPICHYSNQTPCYQEFCHNATICQTSMTIAPMSEVFKSVDDLVNSVSGSSSSEVTRSVGLATLRWRGVPTNRGGVAAVFACMSIDGRSERYLVPRFRLRRT